MTTHRCPKCGNEEISYDGSAYAADRDERPDEDTPAICDPDLGGCGVQENFDYFRPQNPIVNRDPGDENDYRESSWQGYFNAGLPWTAEFEEAVNDGEVDVS